MSILLAGKHEDAPDLNAHDLVNIHSRGRGLWKVTREVLNIFTAAEARFLDFTDNAKNIIDSKEIFFNLIKDSWVLANY